MNVLDTGRRPLATLASDTAYFERTQILHQPPQVTLGHELQRHMQEKGGLTFEAIKYTTTVRNYTLRDAVLDADTLLLIKDGIAIQETAYFVPVHKSHEPAIDNHALIRMPPDEDIVIGCNNAHHGYQHWLTQCVPAIDWSLRHQRNRPVRLIIPALRPWQEDFLRILGYHTVPRLIPQPGRQYFLPHVEYSEFLNGATSFSICLSALETARRIVHALPPAQSAHQFIYVPCANPYYGSIENEAEVMALLLRHGVYIVNRNRLDTTSRIDLFRRADVVMGPHGEGLTDILFSRPGTVLWEWMPKHLQNASLNRLAQAAGARYQGDLVDIADAPVRAESWRVDIGTIERGLTEILKRYSGQRMRPSLDVAWTSATPAPAAGNGKPIDEIMLAFENLGANCEFGFVQRYAGVEPLALLRWASMAGQPETQLERLVDAIARRFEGLGAPGTITVQLTGDGGDFMARESVYNLHYHTGIYPRGIAGDEVHARETRRLGFLRRKFLEDLQTGEKTWVWQSGVTTRADQVRPLLDALRAIGPNKLLWVVDCDEQHPPGTAERLDRDFFKGYVDRFGGEVSLERSAVTWMETCRSVYQLCFATEPASAATVADDASTPPRLSAMDYLAQNAATLTAGPAPVSTGENPRLRRLLSAAVRRLRRR